MTKFNLSKKRDYIYNKIDGKDKKAYYLEKDVKKFVKQLKEIFFCDRINCEKCRRFEAKLDELVGEQLK